MESSRLTLYYSNEDDRAYGLAGMAIILAALDAMDRVSSVSLDADGPMVTFSHTYYYSGSPSVSPKATWDHLISNLYLTSTMVVGNVLARSLVRMGEKELPAEALREVRKTIEEEGRDTCSLEPDEIDALYDRTLTVSRRIFGNPRLHPAIKEFANTISRRRTLSGMELADELHLLQLI